MTDRFPSRWRQGQVRQRLSRILTGNRAGAAPTASPTASPTAAADSTPTDAANSDAGRRALRQVGALRNRLDRLEAEIRESRQLNRRLAEVTDVLAEVLLPAEQRDEERLRTLLERYDRGI